MRTTTFLLLSSLLSIAFMTPAVGADSDDLREMCLPIWNRTINEARARGEAVDQCRASGDRFSDECQEARETLKLSTVDATMPDAVKKVCLPVIVKHLPKETLERDLASLGKSTTSLSKTNQWLSGVAK